MKRTIARLALLTVACWALEALPAAATTTSIVLGEGSQSTTFIATGSTNTISMDLGKCTLGSCTLSGVAHGTGYFASSGAYDITSPTDVDVNLTNSTTGLWTADTRGNQLDFSYGPGGSLLTGYLNLLQFRQIPKSVSGGQDWYLTSANLTITGGSLDLAKGAEVTLYFGSMPAYLNSLLGATKAGDTLSTNFGHGSLSPTPEPASILILGVGFLLVGTVLRYRFRHGL